MSSLQSKSFDDGAGRLSGRAFNRYHDAERWDPRVQNELTPQRTQGTQREEGIQPL